MLLALDKKKSVLLIMSDKKNKDESSIGAV